MITVITVEGVLTQGEDLKQAMPTKWAKPIYDGFRTIGNTLALTKADPEIARWWLRREQFANWSGILTYPSTSAFTWEEWRLDQLRSFLADGWELFAYVDSDERMLQEARQLGVMGICVSYPHMPPGWKDVAAPRSWDSIVTTMDTQTP